MTSYSLLQGLGAGILLGISIAAPPGPVSAMIARRVAMRRSWSAGVAVGLGAMTADAVYLLVTYIGWTKVVSQKISLTGWVYLVSSIVLFLYASWMLVRNVQSRRRETFDRHVDTAGKDNEGSYSYIIGLTMGFSNPYQIAWWLTVGLASISYFGAIVIIGFFGGIVIWLFIISGSLHYGVTKYRNLESAVLYGSSLVLFGFAIWFLFTAVIVL